MIITISTPDKFYFEQLLAFLASLRTNSPTHKAFIYLVDYPEELEDRLSQSFSMYAFIPISVDKLDDRGISLILRRIFLIREFFEQYNMSVSWVDTDVVVRGDLTGLTEVNSNQLKILFRGDNKPEKVRFNAGVFSIGRSDETYSFICDWYCRLRKNAVWGMGQLEMYKAYQKHKGGIELVEMEERFNDLGGSDRPNAFDDESIIWHCKYAHFNNPKFQKEYQHYLKLGKELYNG